MELAWSILTIAVAGAKNKETLYALHFFIGLFEASGYAGIMALLGNFHQPAELVKGACISRLR
jgi:ACS family pantothenate transporter-like MFS transporter